MYDKANNRLIIIFAEKMIDTTYSLEQLNQVGSASMSAHLDIQFTHIDTDYLTASMPIDHRTFQPMSILNGGASAALAETVASFAAYLSIDRCQFAVLGQDLKCTHLRPATDGRVSATARAIHLGRRTHLWEIKILDDKNRHIAFATLGIQVLPLQENPHLLEPLRNSPLGVFME